MSGPRKTRRPLVALIVLLLILAIGYAAQALSSGGSGGNDRSGGNATTGSSSAMSGTVSPASATASISGAVALTSLPGQARTTVRLIQSDGPFPYSQDGVVFRNAERHLPIKSSGYYHEYTVTTPGESDRGARRIITGSSGEFYYTDDHYDSFVRVDVTK